MNQLVFGIVPDRSGHRRQRGKLSSIMYTMFIDHVVVRVWGPEKVFKFYLSRSWEKGFISCHQHVTISSFERFFFSRWKDSSFPAPGWEDSRFPGARSRSRRRVSLAAPALLPAPAEAFLLSQCGVEAFFSCWQKDQQPRRHTVCLVHAVEVAPQGQEVPKRRLRIC